MGIYMCLPSSGRGAIKLTRPHLPLFAECAPVSGFYLLGLESLDLESLAEHHQDMSYMLPHATWASRDSGFKDFLKRPTLGVLRSG